MKKIIGTLIVMALMAVSPANAQVSFGVKGGINNTNMKFDKEVFNSENRYGWFIGPTLKIGLPLGFGADISALYDQKDTKINDESIKQKSILIPVNARYNIGFSETAGIYLAVGPQFGFNVGDDEFSWKNRSDVENTFQLKKSSFSVNLGAGLYLLKNLEVGFTYNIAMGTTGDATFKNTVTTVTSKDTYSKDDTKAKSWTISACLYF